MLGKWADLVRPIPAVAQRTVDENQGRSCALFHIVQREAVPDIGRLEYRCIGIRHGAAMG